jgi:hypothetical protein
LFNGEVSIEIQSNFTNDIALKILFINNAERNHCAGDSKYSRKNLSSNYISGFSANLLMIYRKVYLSSFPSCDKNSFSSN